MSAAALALLAAPAFAGSSSSTTTVTKDAVCVTGVTCITDKTSSALKTSVKGNIYVFNDSDNGNGQISYKGSDSAIVTLDSNNYVYTNGALSNSDKDGAIGIKVDLSQNRSASGLKFENYEESYITNTAIYLDSASTLYLSGSGSGKTGILLDPGTGTGTLTGDIITYYGSVISINGDNSVGWNIAKGATLDGNLLMGGSTSVYQHSTKTQDYTGLYGVLLNGYVSGTVAVTSGGSILTAGAGSHGMFISGQGIGGNLTIAGTVLAEGVDSSSLTSSYSYYYSGNNKKKTYPEGGTALTINASIAKGFEVAGLRYDDDTGASSGSVQTVGLGNAILISPVVTVNGTTTTASSSVVIGLYQSYDYDKNQYTYEQYDPGFGIYNRGSVTISAINPNNSPGAAFEIQGTSALPTYINGGLFSSGAITASAATDDKEKSVTATSLLIGDNVYIGGYYDTATKTYVSDRVDLSTCSSAGCSYTSGTSIAKSDKDGASLVNSNTTGSGTISAAISGKGTGTATALYISAGAHVSSLINSGTISAAATTTNTDTAGTLNAYAIRDMSGTLTYIMNSGKISASATTLDNDEQEAVAIDLSAVKAGMDAYNGVTIVSTATSNSSASITGDINFGDGSNQKIYVAGAGSTYSSKITGDIYYGSTTGIGNLLSIGSFGSVTGRITSESGVSIDIANNGVLYITNDNIGKNNTTCTEAKLHCGFLKATNVTVQDGGYFNIGLKRDSGLTETGVIQATGNVDIKKGANLGLAYNSYIGDPTAAASVDYVVLRSTGTLSVGDLATYSHDTSTPLSSKTDGTMPFLFESADITTKYYDANNALIAACTGKESCSTAYSRADLVLSVKTKTADELKLTGYAKQMFGYANQGLAIDDELGAAMINGIHANVDDTAATGASYEAQKAYDAFAPNVTGGTRAIAVSITDQATGVVAARQRSLRMYGKEEGDLTLWAQEFVQSIKNPGQGPVQEDGSREKNGFKDHGFGVVVGLDAGSPKDGWYGGALTFYNGDVNESGRTAHENQLWFVASGYSSWRGKGLFLDTKADLGYANIKGVRYLHLETGTGSQTSFVRYAQNTHSAVSLSGGVTSGAYLTYGSFTFMPQFSLDGLLLRENGYTEENPYDHDTDGDGFDLSVKSHYAKSLRSFLGTNVRYDFDMWGVFFQPEVRAGYRYDFFHDPVKLKAAFKDLQPNVAGNQTGEWFSLTGPSPAQSNFVLGSSLGLTSGAWSVNLNYDFVRGANSNIQQTATLNLIGRI